MFVCKRTKEMAGLNEECIKNSMDTKFRKIKERI
jgi:hypothetical protein